MPPVQLVADHVIQHKASQMLVYFWGSIYTKPPGSFFRPKVPQGLYIVGDVILNEFHEDGTIDIGLSMQKSSKEIYDCLLEMNTYELDMESRPFIEEQIFQPTWFTTGKGSSEFKLWLPIRIKQ